MAAEQAGHMGDRLADMIRDYRMTVFAWCAFAAALFFVLLCLLLVLSGRLDGII